MNIYKLLGVHILLISIFIFIGCASQQTSNKFEDTQEASSENVNINNFENNEAVEVQDLSDALVNDLLVIEFKKAAQLDPYGCSFLGSQDSIALLSSSPDSIYALTVTGSILLPQGTVLEPGEVAIWTPQRKDPTVAHYHAERLLKTVDVKEETETVRKLRDIASYQKKAIYWGVLRPTGINVKATTIAPVHRARKQYLLNPEIIALRFGTSDKNELARKVVEKWVDALQSGNRDRLASLMSPKMISRNSKPSSDNTASPTDREFSSETKNKQPRKLFAEALLNNDWSNLDNAKVEPLNEPLEWEVSTPERSLIIRLVPGDGLYYIESMEVPA